MFDGVCRTRLEERFTCRPLVGLALGRRGHAGVGKKPPFGIAQIGKSFRNEITPQIFVVRIREFEQMETE